MKTVFERRRVGLSAETEQSDGFEMMPEKRHGAFVRALPIIIVIILIIGLIAGLALWFKNAQSDSYEKAKGRFDEATALIEDADTTVVALDDAVNSQATTEKLDELQALVDEVPAARDKLDDAIGILDSVNITLSSHDEADVVEAARESARNRMDLLDMGTQLVEADIAAVNAADSFSGAWSAIIDADAKSREATALVAEANNETVTQAHELNKQASDGLASASAALAQCSEYLPEADFSSINAYISVKSEQLGYAIASDEAYLAGDTETTEVQTQAYNEADARVVEAASKIPTDPAQLILTAYDARTAELRSSYLDARESITKTDATLRDYLGVNQNVSDAG